MRLHEFELKQIATVQSWPKSNDEWQAWAGCDAPADPVALWRNWLDDAGVYAFVLSDSSELIGYGELWVDEDLNEVELSHIIVPAEHRGRAIGRRLVHLLIEQAGRFGNLDLYIRVLPNNHRAIRCYVKSGFARVSPEDEVEFNVGQRRGYVWMRYAGAIPL